MNNLALKIIQCSAVHIHKVGKPSPHFHSYPVGWNNVCVPVIFYTYSRLQTVKSENNQTTEWPFWQVHLYNRRYLHLLNPFWNHWWSLESDWLSAVRFIPKSYPFSALNHIFFSSNENGTVKNITPNQKFF